MKRPHYFYKTWEKSMVGDRLKMFFGKCDEASEKARQWAKAHGADSYIESPEGMAGGIVALIFDNTLSKEGWERFVNPHGEVFFMPTENSETEKEMFALPVVSEAELISIMGFKARVNSKGKRMPITFGDKTPVMFLHHGWWYADMPYECEEDSLTRIDEKEFYRRKMAATNDR